MTLQATEFSPARPLNTTYQLVREVPVAIVCNAVTLGVMMASPIDLEDFALGFVLTEGIIRDLDELREIEIVTHPKGLEARLWLTPAANARVAARQRSMVGSVGCGLCGIDSLDKVARALPPLPPSTLRLSMDEICAAPDLLGERQPEHDRTHSSHAAGFYIPDQGVVLVREDVGRHNALDKLAGALTQAGINPTTGAVVLTSRVSTEMAQKTVMMGVPAIIAVSAATDYAARLATDANLTLITRVRGNRCEILSASDRVWC